VEHNNKKEFWMHYRLIGFDQINQVVFNVYFELTLIQNIILFSFSKYGKFIDKKAIKNK